MMILSRHVFRRKRKREFFFLPVTILFVVVALVVLVRFIAPGLYTSLIAHPLLALRSSLQSSNLSEIEQLRKENQRLERELIRMKALEEENSELRDLLGLLEEDGGSYETREVLVKQPETPYDILIIEGGRNRGSEIGDLVYSDPSIAIGEVAFLTSSYSYVTLFSSESSAVSVLIGGKYGGEAQGAGGGNLHIAVPSSYEVEIGMVIEHEETGDIIGEVERIKEGARSDFKTLIARLPFDVTTLRHVFVRK